MQALTEAIYHLGPPASVFDETVLRNLFPSKSAGARKLLVHRAVAAGEILRLKPGLFCLAEPFQKSRPHPFLIAGLLHFPSHISMESALRHLGLVPEAVREIASVTTLRSRTFSTPLGIFSFTRVPASAPRAGVRPIDLGDGLSAFMATAVRAIGDLIYSRPNIRWKKNGMDFLTESLRMDVEALKVLHAADFDEVVASVRNRRTRDFLLGLQKEILR